MIYSENTTVKFYLPDFFYFSEIIPPILIKKIEKTQYRVFNSDNTLEMRHANDPSKILWCDIPLKEFKDNVLIPKDPLNPPTVSLFFSDLLPT